MASASLSTLAPDPSSVPVANSVTGPPPATSPPLPNFRSPALAVAASAPSAVTVLPPRSSVGAASVTEPFPPMRVADAVSASVAVSDRPASPVETTLPPDSATVFALSDSAPAASYVPPVPAIRSAATVSAPAAATRPSCRSRPSALSASAPPASKEPPLTMSRAFTPSAPFATTSPALARVVLDSDRVPEPAEAIRPEFVRAAAESDNSPPFDWISPALSSAPATVTMPPLSASSRPEFASEPVVSASDPPPRMPSAPTLTLSAVTASVAPDCRRAASTESDPAETVVAPPPCAVAPVDRRIAPGLATVNVPRARSPAFVARSTEAAVTATSPLPPMVPPAALSAPLTSIVSGPSPVAAIKPRSFTRRSAASARVPADWIVPPVLSTVVAVTDALPPASTTPPELVSAPVRTVTSPPCTRPVLASDPVVSSIDCVPRSSPPANVTLSAVTETAAACTPPLTVRLSADNRAASLASTRPPSVSAFAAARDAVPARDMVPSRARPAA